MFFVAIALVLLLVPADYRERIARAVRGTILRPVMALQQGAVERHVLFEDPARLRAERDSLAAFLVGNANLAAENRQLRDLLGLRDRLPPSFVPAEVVRIPGRGSEGYFQLTAGAAHGVAPGSSIVAAQGLVGRVREVDESLSFGIDWMHPEFRASAMTLDGEVYGILEPRRVGAEPMLVLTGTPRHVTMAEGTQVLTSGHGGVFPRGIPVGVVVGQEGGEAGWARNYLVRPLVSPGEMGYVLVLGDPQRSLDGRDLALVWGIRDLEAPSEEELLGGNGAPGAGAGAPAGTTPAPTGEPAEGPEPAAPQPPGPSLLGEPVTPP